VAFEQLNGPVPVVIISGLGGCGKTFVVSRFLSHQHRYNLDTEVLVCATTGKASLVLRKNLQKDLPELRTHTVHHVFFSWLNDLKAKKKENAEKTKERSERGVWNYSNTKLLVIDEASLLELDLFSRVLLLLPKLEKIILLGDPNQLPSVGPGSVLKDLVTAASDPGGKLSAIIKLIVLKENHRSGSELLQRGILSVHNKSPTNNAAFQIIRTQSDNIGQFLLSNSLDQNTEQSQILAFKNVICNNINNWFKEKRGKHESWAIGDKVCVRKNGQCQLPAEMIDSSTKGGPPMQEFYNGEVLFIRDKWISDVGKKSWSSMSFIQASLLVIHSDFDCMSNNRQKGVLHFERRDWRAVSDSFEVSSTPSRAASCVGQDDSFLSRQ